MEKELLQGTEQLGIELSNTMIEKFKIYYNELLAWNKKMNLVSHGDEKRIVSRHFLDSLNATQFIPQNAQVIDVGSGAGFPGIPIKIIREDIKIDLLEPKLKRFNFLNHLVNTLGLDVRICRTRVEQFSSTVPVYGVILARSVGKLKWITKVVSHILADDGLIITYKGSRFVEELKEVRGWKIEHITNRKFCLGSIVVLRRNET